MGSLGIVELLRLDKSLDMFKSNHQLNTAMSTNKPCLNAVFTPLLKTSRVGKFTVSLGSPFLCQNALFMNKFQPKPLWDNSRSLLYTLPIVT